MHFCAVQNGAVKCWGFLYSDNLGVGSCTGSCATTSQNVSVLTSGVNKVDVGYGFSCALRDDQKVYCWGNNSDGELGQGTTTGSSATPLQVGLPADIIDIAVSYGTACAVSSTQGVYCWGINWTATPTQIAGTAGKSIEQLSMSYDFPYFRMNGVLQNAQGGVPTAMPVNFEHLFYGSNGSTDSFCGLQATGGALCYGGNGHGQLGVDYPSPADPNHHTTYCDS